MENKKLILNFRFIEYEKYILSDPKSERQHKLSLRVSIKMASEQLLYDKYTIFVTPTTIPPFTELSSEFFFFFNIFFKNFNYFFYFKFLAIIKCAGGKCVNKLTDFPFHQENLLVISSIADRAIWRNVKRKFPKAPIIDTEAFMVSILRQKIHFQPERIFG